MKNAQKPDHVGLNTLIDWIGQGQFVVPDFQREFEWEPWDIGSLMRSVFLDYYIGSLLLWKGRSENFAALSCEPIQGFDGKERPIHIVLDGQQRLTAIHYAFFAPDHPLPRRKNRYLFFIRVDRFMCEDYDDAFAYEWLPNRVAKILSTPEEQFEQHIFPLNALSDRYGLFRWAEEYSAFWNARAAEAEVAGDDENLVEARRWAEDARPFRDHLQGICDQYQVAYVELDEDLAVDKVCDIFTQVNSRGVRLDVFDLINALLRPKGLKLKQMWRDAQQRLQFVDSARLNVYVLQVMSILAQAYCSPKYLYYLLPGQEKVVRNPDGSKSKETLVATPEEFESRWTSAVSHLERAIDLLKDPREFGAISSAYLPYVSILPTFAALRAHLQVLPPEGRLSAQRKLRHWYWASIFTNRYSGSVESTAARDFLDVSRWMTEDDAEPALIREFAYRFRQLELRGEIRKGTSIYNGVFNLLILNGARDWVKGEAPSFQDLDDHHIVPSSWGKEHLSEPIIGSILNRTPLTAETNRHVISDRLPNEYLPEIIAASGESAVRGILESHLISPLAFDILLRDPFTPADFEEFIAERQRTIRGAIDDLLIKDRLVLAPNLREIDAQIEAVELRLRRLIELRLGRDWQRVPSHVAQKVLQRVQRELRKNPGLDSSRLSELAGRLEFFDLRELQDTVVNKGLWGEFESTFQSKESLATKFGQLADLRNALRHSRSADEITLKEGEAAILWFERVLPH